MGQGGLLASSHDQTFPIQVLQNQPEIIRLAVMYDVRFPFSLRNVGDLLRERCVEVSHETIRFWWQRFGPMFASEIRKRRTQSVKSNCWRWHLDEVFVRIIVKQH